MAWTTPVAYVSGAVATAAGMNTYVKDNLLALRAILDGTAQAFGSSFYPTTDTLFRFRESGGPIWDADTGDLYFFNRAANEWRWQIGGTNRLILDAVGKLTGTGFYDSGEVSVTNGNTGTVSHGLGARPRVVAAFAHTASGSADSKTLPIPPTSEAALVMRISGVTSTQISVFNNAGGTRYFNIYAML